MEFRYLDALGHNVFWVAFLTLGIPFILLSAARERRPDLGFLRPFRWHLGFLWIILTAMILFTAVRNL